MRTDAVDEIAQQWAREKPDLALDSIGVIARILRIAKLIADERRAVLSQLNIDSATFDLIATLRRSGRPYRMSPTEIARDCLVSGGAISQRVTRAEADGLVRTTRTDSGKRTLWVELTDRGHRIVERDIEVLLGRERQLIAHLAGDDRDRLAELLRTLLAGLTPAEPETGTETQSETASGTRAGAAPAQA
ncbi:MAG TPA: MarR family transcriptional regulator [Pseudonocardia sp.]|nr:MarR family transcriptional regulator [Pseudonocardia sp.]